MSKNKTESKWEELNRRWNFHQVGCDWNRNRAFGNKVCDMNCKNVFDNVISRIEKEAFEKGKEEERKAMYNDECLIIKRETRLQTLEEVEKKIEERKEHEYWLRFENEGSDYTEACDDILQTIKEMKK